MATAASNADGVPQAFSAAAELRQCTGFGPAIQSSSLGAWVLHHLASLMVQIDSKRQAPACLGCSLPPQELDQAGQWESFLAAAGLINSPRDYGLPAGEEGSSGSGGAACSSDGKPGQVG